jgi:hypothetical protein
VLDAAKRHFIERAGVPCVTKPFEVNEIRRVMHRVLAAPSAP